jgi:hypothetical protein
MNEFETDNKMEQIARLSEKQPDAISSEQRMALGLYQTAKTTANGLTADELLVLRGFKQSILRDILTPNERTIMALEIQNLEKRIGANKND